MDVDVNITGALKRGVPLAGTCGVTNFNNGLKYI